MGLNLTRTKSIYQSIEPYMAHSRYWCTQSHADPFCIISIIRFRPAIRSTDGYVTPWAGHISTCIQETTYTDGCWRVWAGDRLVRTTVLPPCHLHLFTGSSPLEFLKRDILGSLPKPSTENSSVAVLTEFYCKLSRTIPTKTGMPPEIITLLLDSSLVPYRIVKGFLMKNIWQVFNKFLNSMCAHLGTKLLTTTIFHPKRMGNWKHNKTIASRLSHYVNDFEEDWHAYVLLLTCAYNSQTHRLPNTIRIRFIFTKELLPFWWHRSGISNSE